MLDSAFRTSVILPKCREYNIIQRAVSASLLVPMLYDHIDSKFKSDPVLQGGEDMGTEAGYQLFPILKSLSDLRKRPDDQCWAYEEQPWWSDIVSLLILTKQRIIVDHFLIAPLGVLGTQVGVPKKRERLWRCSPSRHIFDPLGILCWSLCTWDLTWSA